MTAGGPRQMWTCPSCGYENTSNGTEGAQCPLCGTSGSRALTAARLRSPGDGPTLPFSEALTQPGGPDRRTQTVYPEGHLYAGRYQVVRFVGRGGMGSV